MMGTMMTGMAVKVIVHYQLARAASVAAVARQ